MPPVGFEPTISTGERPQTYALDRAATETVQYIIYIYIYIYIYKKKLYQGSAFRRGVVYPFCFVGCCVT